MKFPKLSQCILPVVTLGIFLKPSFSVASTFTLPQLDSTQIDPIFDVLASTSTFRSLEPPSHPRRFGFWFNARADISSANKVSTVFGSNSNGNYVPFGNIQFGAYLPAGFGLEFGFLPSMSITGTRFSSFGANIRWTANQLLKFNAVDITAKAGFCKSSLTFGQTLQNANINVDYSNSQYSFGADIGKRFSIFEPYIGFSLLHHSSTLAGTGTVSLFGSSFPAGTTSYSNSGFTGWFRAGLEIKLLVLTLGAQYDTAYGVSTYAFKVGFKF